GGVVRGLVAREAGAGLAQLVEAGRRAVGDGGVVARVLSRLPGLRAGPRRAHLRGAPVIDGVVVQSLRRIADERGSVLHMLKAGDAWFPGFGEIYFSTVYPGVVKGWHLHQRMIL